MANEITSVSGLLADYERVSRRVKSLQEKSADTVGRAMVLGAGFAGAALGGAIRGAGYPMIPETEIETDLAVGAVLAIAGVMGFGGKHADMLTAGGMGMAAPAMSRMSESVVRDWMAK